MTPRSRHAQTVRRKLLRWFRKHARPLPWRKSRDPYAVWVSEVMLQQTRVATVVPYYKRFLRAFPTVQSLARAPLDRVLELWSGLGYYRRARHLHQAAKIVAQQFHGHFPREYAAARALPGIGDYTARAILSIAYDQPYGVLDGNAARLVARLEATQYALHAPRFRRALYRKLLPLLSRRHPGIFNQALMELGQTVCLPRAPRCPICPLRTCCRAYRAGQPESFPAPRRRRPAEIRYLAAAIIWRRNRVAVVRGLDEGLVSDLWNFPAAFGSSKTEAARRLAAKLAGMTSCAVRLSRQVGEIYHHITHRLIIVELYPGELSGVTCDGFRWLPLSRLERLAISQLTRKIAVQLRARQSAS